MTGFATRLGFGGSSLGNLMAPVSAEDAASTVDKAWELGLRHYDTAPHYGRGLAERRLGDALRARTGFTLSTKAGRVLEPDTAMGRAGLHDGFVSPMPFRARYDYSAAGILRSHEASLHRLGLAYIDRLLVHDVGSQTHGANHGGHWHDLLQGGGWRALQRLREDGCIGGIGLGVNETAVCLSLMQETQVDTILIAGRYTLLDQSALDALLPACLQAGTQVWLAAPFNGGILATGPDGPGTPYYDYAPAAPELVAKVRRINAVAARHGVPLPAAALQFPLHHPAVAQVIAGFRHPTEVERAIAWMKWPIPADFWAELKAQGLLREDASCG
ncbi:aldo/keto reductase [Novosphingobium sp. SG720]|uniref:aldo/keto reductase n=1 Tax=Novosphingobium sp. SG720 TaxID=2586998 RepID=UPI0014453E89|nr:aldo/keto reductase [Novosphingobium sp. SG720]NKJ42233.1 D-threo-aldose 1-dehydrogenase [Novosphingobium sp. SG720]